MAWEMESQALAPRRGHVTRALLAILAALLVAFDTACLSALLFLVLGQTLGYLSLLGWTHAMIIVGIADATVFLIVLAVLLYRWRPGHRHGRGIEITAVTLIAGIAAVLLGQSTLAGLQMAFTAVDDPASWDIEQLLPSILDWL